MTLTSFISGDEQNHSEVEKNVRQRMRHLDNEIQEERDTGNDTLADIKRIQGAIKLAELRADHDSKTIDRIISRWIEKHLPQADSDRLNRALENTKGEPQNAESDAPGTDQEGVGADETSDEVIVDTKEPDETLDDLEGPELRNRLYTQVVVSIMSSYEVDANIPVYTGENDNPGSFLFHGEPGTGKTHAAEAVAWALSQLEYSVGFYPATGSHIKSSEYSESEQRLKRLLRNADNDGNEVSIVLIDEFEDVADRSGHRATAAIANALQSVTSGADVVESVVVIGTTNHPDRISEAIKNRFNNVKFSEPSRTAKLKILQSHLGEAQDFSADKLRTVGNIEGLTGRDMKKAAKAAADDSLLQGGTEPTSINEMYKVKQELQRTPSVSISSIKAAIQNRR